MLRIPLVRHIRSPNSFGQLIIFLVSSFMVRFFSMRFICLLLILCLATLNATHAQSPSPGAGPSQALTDGVGAPIQVLCNRIRVLTVLNKTASDPMALNDLVAKGKIKEDQLAFVKSNAAAFSSQLQTLTSNATLKTECDTINASRKVARQCKRLKKLERVVNLASNNTADAERLIGDILKKKDKDGLAKTMEKVKLQLQKLKSNSTLLNLCKARPGQQQEQQSGIIGNQAVDNSGTIGTSTSGANASLCSPCYTTYLLATILLAVFARP